MQGSISFDGGLNGSIVSSGSLSGSIDTSGSGSTVTIQPTLFEGQKIADYTIDGVGGELYAPEPEDVEITPTYNSGVKVADYSIGEEEGSIYVPDYTEYQVGFEGILIGSDDEYIEYSFIYYKSQELIGKRCLLRGFKFYTNNEIRSVQPNITMEDDTRIWFDIIIPNPSGLYVYYADYMIYLLYR